MIGMMVFIMTLKVDKKINICICNRIQYRTWQLVLLWLHQRLQYPVTEGRYLESSWYPDAVSKKEEM